MNPAAMKRLQGLIFLALVAVLVWWFYRRRTFSKADRFDTFGPRFWTGFVDTCVLWPIGFMTTALLTLNLPKTISAGLVVLESVAWLFYTVFLHARYGQTVGKMVTKVRVVDFRTEAKISLKQAWLREGIPMALSCGFLAYEVYLILSGQLAPSDIHKVTATDSSKVLWTLSMLPGLWFLAEVGTMLTNSKRRALHDLIAGTVVVRTNTR
jgi:uncharacterized RDD family membrane protein YckC